MANFSNANHQSEAFAAVAEWCGDYLGFQYSQDLSRQFVELLDSMGAIAAVHQDRSCDRFDQLKVLEKRIDRGLQTLGTLHAACLAARSQATSTEIATAESTLLFVYGTLKRGFSRDYAMAGQQFLGHAVTSPQYRMFDCGSYPGLVQQVDGGCEVVGELWEVDSRCLAALDEVEGVSLNLYRRGPVRLQAPHDAKVIETYYYQRGVADLRDCGSEWT